MRAAPRAGAARLLSFALALIGLMLNPAAAAPVPGAGSIPIFVSILPEKYFVERVGGEHVSVAVMVQPGQSPATYEATPRQLTALGGARLYFRIGVAFENVWMERIRAANPTMTVIALQAGMPLRDVDRLDDRVNGRSGGQAVLPSRRRGSRALN